MTIEDLDFTDIGLWPHQTKAIERVEKYFHSKSTRGCLVQMPTGTGKTGVMAVLASRRTFERAVLVVCPSSALAEQLIDQISDSFWDKINAKTDWKPTRVVQILPSKIHELAKSLKANDGERTVLVGTIQAIQQANSNGTIGELHGLVGTILFDEGHREPAPSWADVVRGFGVPTVLFSATPFRGDLKVFDVSDEDIHFLSFMEALENNLIRGVEIDERELSHDVGTFAQQLLECVDKLVEEGRFSEKNKVIVRCSSEESVVELYQALTAALGERADGIIAVHNNFKGNSESGMMNSVPRDLSKRSERFLIHQYMLIEGIDDPSCTILAFYEPFSNSRMLVQQIGRLIRHPGPLGQKAQNAHVFARTGEDVAVDWQSFLSFDKACENNGGVPFVRNDQKVLEDLVKALPEQDYIAGKFRSRIDLDGLEIHDDLQFPRSAVAFHVSADLDMADLQECIGRELANADRYQAIIGEAADGNCRYHVTLRLTPSPFLASHLFHAPSLEATIYTKVGNRIFFYDSAGLWINEVDGIGPRVNAKSLRALLPAGSENVISFMNVKNTDLGPLSLRSRSLSARSLERSGVFLGEHLNVVTRASGTILQSNDKDYKRRSVGFSRARVRDGKGTNVNASEFADWCNELNDELETKAKSASIFSRFAAPAETPMDTTPVNILIDILEMTDLFTSESNKETDIETENLCVDIQPDADPKAPGKFKFKLCIDKVDHDVWIDWISKKRKYWLTSPSLSKIKSKNNTKVSLTRRLNQLQPFRIITADLQHTYVGGDFYSLELDLKSSGSSGKAILGLLTPVPGLSDMTSEKGKIRDGHFDDWEDGSLFQFIDQAINPDRGPAKFGLAFPNVVCDDLQDEVGDFIGVDKSADAPRVALIVAKWKKGNPGVSASAFYDVCAQGVKNLAYLKSDGAPLPGKEKRFDGNWKLSVDKGKPTVKTQTVNRLRCGVASRAFRKSYQQMRLSPSTERTIWLVCSGGMLSIEKLRVEFNRPVPKPHILQFYHLLMSTYSACQSVGVQLRVFCSE